MQDTFIYLYPLLVILISILPIFKQGEKLSHFSFLCVFFISSVLMFLRDPFAPTDSNNYASMYSQAYQFEYIWTAYHGNIFFSLLQWIGQQLSLEYGIFMKLYSILCLSLVSCGLFLLVPKRLLALSEGFFVISSTFILLFTNVVRQGLALSLILLAIGLYINHYKKACYFLFLLAIYSHFSAIVIFLVFLLSSKYQHIKNIRRNNFIFLLIIPFLFIPGYVILNIIPHLGGLFGKIESLGSRDYYQNFLVYIKLALMYLLAWFLYFFCQPALVKEKFDLLFQFYIFLVALSIFLSPVLLLSSRFVYYGSALMPILLAHFYQISWGNNLRYIKLLAFFVLAIMYGFVVMSFPSTSKQLGF